MESFANYPDLQGKIALVTGVGQMPGSPDLWGNGAAIARVLCRNGVKVFGCDLDMEAAKETKKRIEAEGGEIEITQADVTVSTAVRAFVEKCVSRWGRVDILVNNVGRSAPGDPASMSEEVWDSQTDINLKSVYLTCHAVLPIMEKQGSGSVVNISSVAGLRYIGKPQVAYSATKAAVIQLTKTTAVIYAPKGVRLNVVVPGLMHTPLMGYLADKYAGGDLEGFLARRANQVPMGKQGNSTDVANAAVFLTSNCSRYITGQEIVVDGGITSFTGH